MAEPPLRARTVDVLIPPAEPAARILVCERPAAGDPGGVAVAVIAVARSNDEARRSRTAAKLALDAKMGGENGLPAAADDGRGRGPRFRPEWALALGLTYADGPEAAPLPLRPLASSQTLFALRGAQAMLGRPSVVRSRLDKTPNDARPVLDPALLDGLVGEGLVERTFVLMCRDTGQIVGIGADAAEVQAAMRLTLRCPHCRRPLSEELQDVVYSLSAQGEEFIQSTRWVREALEASLRKRHCDAVVLADAATGRVDGAACYKDTVLLLFLRDRAPAEEEMRGFYTVTADFERAAAGVPVRCVVVTTQQQRRTADAAAADGRRGCAVLDAAHLDEGLDRLLEDVRQEAFARLTGTTIDVLQPDPMALLSRLPA